MPNELPFKAFAYLDISHPPVAWNVYRGILVSAKAEKETDFPVSLMFAGMIQHQNNLRLHNELMIERVRAEKFPHQTSRLTGLYFFTDKASAKAAQDQNWGDHFRPENLAELEVCPVRPSTRVDANWITYAELNGNGRIDLATADRFEKYWAGEQYSDTPVWETIVDGKAIIWGTELRQRAYNLTAQESPTALGILELARISADLGSDLGKTSAGITRISENRFLLAYYLDMRDAENTEFLERLSRYEGARNTKDLKLGMETPDFRPYGCEFTVSRSDCEVIGSYRVHRESDI